MTALSTELHIADPYALRLLEFGLDDATDCHNAVSGAFGPGIGQREYSDALRALQKALLKVQYGKGTLEAAQKTINRAVYEIPDHYRHAMDTQTKALFHLPPIDRERSNFEVLAVSLGSISQPERTARAGDLLEAIEKSLENVNTPGKGGARRDTQRYTAGIIKLAEWFSEALPDRAIYADENSLFFHYVKHWLNTYIRTEKADADKVVNPERHIKYALEKISF